MPRCQSSTGPVARVLLESEPATGPGQPHSPSPHVSWGIASQSHRLESTSKGISEDLGPHGSQSDFKVPHPGGISTPCIPKISRKQGLESFKEGVL